MVNYSVKFVNIRETLAGEEHNSPHSVYDQLIKRAHVPIYSIADATIFKAHEKRLKKVLLLGVKHTMDSTFYPEAGGKSIIDLIVPSEQDKRIVDNIIFSELCVGIVRNESKDKLIALILKYDVDGVIFGCTEFPQIIQESDL